MLERSDLKSVPEVRRALRKLLGSWGVEGRRDVAELLACELVTNALVHTDEEAELTATLDGGGELRIEVRDFTERRPVLRESSAVAADDSSTHGRGLMLVQTLADEWGVTDKSGGKSVWFQLHGGPA